MTNFKRFYDYKTFLHSKFGEKVYKISVDAGFTCPNIDGTVARGGCIYCNNRSFSPAVHLQNLSIAEQLQSSMGKMRRRFKAKKFLAYFQPHTNTHAPVSQLENIYAQALEQPDIVGLVIGTRPDAVDEEKLGLLQQLAQDVFVSIEYGMQSVNNRTLAWINRGHTYEAFVDAVRSTQNRGLYICAHVMLGFPTETKQEMLAMAKQMNHIGIHGIKLHNLLVTRGTLLAKMYTQKPFPLFTYNEYIELVCDFLERLEPGIVVERLFATTPPEYLLAPVWEKMPQQITNDIVQTLIARNSYQGRLL